MRNKVFMLSEMAGRVVPVADPEADFQEYYVACLRDIDTWLTLGEKRILELARKEMG
jgi:hypothetical protein